jgi:hypothetical protein
MRYDLLVDCLYMLHMFNYACDGLDAGPKPRGEARFFHESYKSMA